MSTGPSKNHQSYGHQTEEVDIGVTLAELSKYRLLKAVDEVTKASQFLTNTERDAVFDLARKSLYGQGSQGTKNKCNSTSNFINTPPANAASGAEMAVVSTNVLQGLVACVSTMSDEDKETYHQLIVELGGSYHSNFGADLHVTHLIIPPENVHASAKYLFLQKKRSAKDVDQVEKEWAVSVKVVSPDWLLACSNFRSHVSETSYEIITESQVEPPLIPSMEQTPLIPSKTTHSSTLDNMMLEFPEVYPNGDITYYIDKVPGDSNKKYPVIGWARQSSRGVSKCLGCWVCPRFHEGCSYRVRPQVPRRGKQSTGGIPPLKSDQKCHAHQDAVLVLQECKCKWTVKEDKAESRWNVTHHGTHTHPVPPPNRATHQAKKELRKIILHNPEAKPCQLTTGISGGKLNTVPRVGNIDPKFEHAGYVSKVRQKILKEINKEMTGSEYAPESLDAVFQFMQQTEERSPGTLLGAEILPSRQHVTYASQQMRDLLKTSVTGFTSDTIEGWVDSVYYRGEINVTMTSTWCPILKSQAPVLFSVLLNKSSKSYELHWDYFFKICGEDASGLDNFYDSYPGNTSDFSEAIRSAYMNSLDSYCLERFRRKMTDEMKRDVYRYCNVHYLRNVHRVGNVSAVVHPDDRDDFIRIATSLLDIDDFDVFSATVESLYGKFPSLSGWFLWYLQDSRASILFPAVRNLSDHSDQIKFNAMQKNTNPQEGLGGHFQALKNYKKLGLQATLQHIELIIVQYDRRRQLAKEGMETKYARATPQEKKIGREKKSQYKAPESAADLLRTLPSSSKRPMSECDPGSLRPPTKSSMKSVSEDAMELSSSSKKMKMVVESNQDDHDGPVKLENSKNICFLNSLFQNLYANHTFRTCVMETNFVLEKYLMLEQPIVRLKMFMQQISKIRNKGISLKPTHLEQILYMMEKDKTLNYTFGDQLEPMEVLHFTLSRLHQSEDIEHPIIANSRLLSYSLTEKFRCNSCCNPDEFLYIVGPDNPLVDCNETLVTEPNYFVQLMQCPGKTLDDCLRRKFLGENELGEAFPHSIRCSCLDGNSDPVSKCSFASWQGDDDKILILSIANRDWDNQIVPKDQCIMPMLNIDLTPYFSLSESDVAEGVTVSGSLTGYISHLSDLTTSFSSGLVRGHYISITKSLHCDDFFLSDDLCPYRQERLGPTPLPDWEKPIILFYDVSKIYSRGKRMSLTHPAQCEIDEQIETERRSEELLARTLMEFTQEENEMIETAIHGHGDLSDVILTPEDDTKVTREDMHCLQEECWLNDAVINAFLKLCLMRRDEMLCNAQTERNRSHFFNSFFIQNLFDEKNDLVEMRNKYNYDKVARWSRKVPGGDIFQLKYVFFPRNVDNYHWTSVLVMMERKKIMFYDPYHESKMVLSNGVVQTDMDLLNGVLQYLKDEWCHKHPKETMDWSQWELYNLANSNLIQNDSKQRQLPEQQDGKIHQMLGTFDIATVCAHISSSLICLLPKVITVECSYACSHTS